MPYWFYRTSKHILMNQKVENVKYLVTGAAGFIGSAVVERLTQMGHSVVGVDNLNDYYDVNLKLARLERIEHPLFVFEKMDIADSNLIGHLNILEGCRHNKVGHLVYAFSSSVYGLNGKGHF